MKKSPLTTDTLRESLAHSARSQERVDDPRFLSALDLSRACITLIRQWLKESGRDARQRDVADALGVSQSMISHVLGKQNKPLSLEVLHRGAACLGRDPVRFWEELIATANDDTSIVDARRRERAEGNVLDDAFRVIEVLRARLFDKKPEGECKADTFYRLTIKSLHRLLRPFDAQATALAFKSARNTFLLVASGGCKSAKHVSFLRCNVPASVNRALDEVWTNKDPVTEVSLSRPSSDAESEFAGFWENLLGAPATARRQRLRLLMSRIYKKDSAANLHLDRDYSMTLMSMFKHGSEVTEDCRRCIWLFADLAGRVHSVELQGHADAVAKLWGVSLLPQDVRPHADYYKGGDFGVLPGTLEATLQSLFKRITQEDPFKGRLAALDVWSYDWTVGKFSLLSPYCRYVNTSIAQKQRVMLPEGDLSYQDAYLRYFEDLTPRGNGKTAYVLRSRRAIVVEDPTVIADAVNPRHPELEIGTLVGVPLWIHDRQNDRYIHTVLYMRFVSAFRHIAVHAVAKVMSIVRASDEFRDFEIVLASSGKDGPATGQRDSEILQSGQNRFREETYLPELATVDGERVNEIVARI